jgi:hypothetical protein
MSLRKEIVVWFPRMSRYRGGSAAQAVEKSDKEFVVHLSASEIDGLLRPHFGDLGSYDEVGAVRAATDRAVSKLRAARDDG